MNALGTAQQTPQVENVVLGWDIEESFCQKTQRVALKILYTLSILGVFGLIGFVSCGAVPGWHVGLIVVLYLASNKLDRWCHSADLKNPATRSKVLEEAQKLSFQELTEFYSLRQILDYQILPRQEILVKATRYLEGSVLKKESVPMELLDQLVEENIISAQVRQWYNQHNHQFLFLRRISLEVAYLRQFIGQ
jgi:hypothetical protein